MNYTPFKGRTVAKGDKVEVYRNLHNGKISIRDPKTKLVLGHTDTIYLADVTFKVHQKGRERVLNEKRKNVHAFAIGNVVDAPILQWVRAFITYNPYKYESFVDEATFEPVHRVERVLVKSNGVIASL